MTDQKSTWAMPHKRRFPALKGRVTADVAIIGGGLAGVLAAYEISRRGFSVCLLEKGRLGSGVTEYTTGFLTMSLDTDLTDLVKMYGAKGAKLAWQSHREAIRRIGEIARKENIDCEYARCPNFSYAKDAEGLVELEGECNAARRLGFKSRMVSNSYLGFENFGACMLPDQAKYHPVKFLRGVVDSFPDSVQAHEDTEVVDVVESDGGFMVMAKGGLVQSTYAITATYQPFNNPKEVFLKKGMYVSYVMEAAIPKGMIREGTYEDMDNPYNYFRVDAGRVNDRMVIGGQDHRKEIPISEAKNFRAVEEVLAKIMGGRKYQIKRRWSSRVLEPSDGLALIGEVNPNEFVATAFSGNGMTYSSIAATLLADLIEGRKNPYRKLYDPTRVPTFYQLAKKGRDYAGELLGGAVKNILKPAGRKR